ncbi:MAG: hypothetical protein J6I72_00815 [Muribaculaceae bacterium]|nr:hypothetical protein [Muribaculaceae bacterium]
MTDKVKLVSNTHLYLDCRALLNEILDITPNFPRAYKFTIGAEMQRLGVSLLQTDAAAYMDKAGRLQHLIKFKTEFETLKTLTRIAGERKWIKGKGQLYGINTLKADIVECSENYTKDCYIMKLDLKGFFMSIDKAMLADMIDRFILQYYTGSDIEDLRYLCRIVILHCPEKNCERHSPAYYWDYLPANKSLFTNGEGKGVAIGNLFAQLFANFLLNVLDWYLEELGFKYHGRYVDDFYLIHREKTALLNAVQPIRDKLAALGLCLNEKKFYLQHYKKGVEFTGSIVKPNRNYCCNRTITNFIAAVRRLNNAKNLRQVIHAVCSINSYLGLLRHSNEYNMRKKILCMIEPQAYEYIYIKGRYEIVALKNKYKQRRITLKRIRDGDY